MSIKVLEVKHVRDHIIEVKFSDNCIKRFDFSKIESFDGEMRYPLKDVNFFSKVKIITNGGAIAWPNEYDCCVDWLRYYAIDEKKEWEKYDEDFPLEERIKLTQKKLVA